MVGAAKPRILKYFFRVTLCTVFILSGFLFGCSSSSTPEPFKVTSTVKTTCLDGTFEMDIPVGMSSDGSQQSGSSSDCEAFYPDEGGTSSSIFIIAQNISPVLGADEYVSTYFDKPPSSATYKYKNIKIEELSRDHYIASADIFEDGAEDSIEKRICFSIDGNVVVTITFENIQKTYTNTVEASIRVL